MIDSFGQEGLLWLTYILRKSEAITCPESAVKIQNQKKSLENTYLLKGSDIEKMITGCLENQI